MCHFTTDVTPYQDLLRRITPSRFHSLLVREGPGDPPALVVCAVLNDVPVGVLIAPPDMEDPAALCILHLLVSEPARRRGVGSGLVRFAEAEAGRRGFASLGMLHHGHRGAPEVGTLRPFFAKNGWGPVQLEKTDYFVRNAAIAQAAWFILDLPAGYELVPWRDLTQQERADVRAQKERFAHLDRRHGDGYVDPFEIAHFEAETSLGVRDVAGGGIVGWCITQDGGDGLLWFRRIYVAPQERNKGILFPLLANAIQRCLGTFDGAHFTVTRPNRKMKIGMEIMMRGLCGSVIETYSSTRPTCPPAP